MLILAQSTVIPGRCPATSVHHHRPPSPKCIQAGDAWIRQGVNSRSMEVPEVVRGPTGTRRGVRITAAAWGDHHVDDV
ncbi:hypothetical protein GDO81_016784 [Engystomops pustulosus]|uniref:Uncharacterized protein n=1 Tax=Engystomops pustulosus TaxID=76066 RepID=A0AAV7A9I6_ENGPU|nr:hypothetical protein GDO81_016784 [Engystomops pustulosus]